MQELRQSVQLLLQFGEAFEARMRGGTEVSLSTLPLQNEAQIQLEHASERQAYETFERILHYAKWEQAVIHHGHWELIIACHVYFRISFLLILPLLVLLFLITGNNRNVDRFLYRKNDI